MTTYWRLSSKPMTDADCHENHTSRLWVDMGDDDAARSGLSVCLSLDGLVSYFVGRPGEHSPGRGAVLAGAYLIEVEGDLSGDEAWEELYGEALIHPTRIVSCKPITETDFVERLRAGIEDTYCRNGERCIHRPDHDDFEIQKKCSHCDGSGIDDDGEECWQCDGHGWE